MTYHYYGDKNADIVLIQPVGDHDLPEIENEVAEIKKLTSVDFQLIAVKVEDWNRGLFALWASFQTEKFSGVAAASPSVWFPDFVGYMKEDMIKCDAVYLSLGDKEERTKNAVMSKVGNCIRESYDLLTGQGIECALEWNKGGHFKEPALRTAKGFAWVMNGR